MKPVLSVDPGMQGGIAWCFNDETNVEPVPQTMGDLIAMFVHLKCIEPSFDCYLEAMSGRIPGASASSMAKYARSFGNIEGALAALGIRTIIVHPKKWQKFCGVGAKLGRTQTQWKNHLKAEAQRRYPNLEITLKTADALLILDYAKGQSV